VQTWIGFCLHIWGLLGERVYLALVENIVKELAGALLVLLNLGRFNIRFTPCILQHDVQEILLEVPLLRLGEFMAELGGIRLWCSIEISWAAKVLGKCKGIISGSFSIVCRGDLCLLLVLGFLRGSPLGAGAASVLLPAAHSNYFHLSLVSGLEVEI
jgi:hypothetical protein